jgi:hypothetical protein
MDTFEPVQQVSPAMRSSLLQIASFQLAMLLATVPVRLIFLALDPRIHVN